MAKLTERLRKGAQNLLESAGDLQELIREGERFGSVKVDPKAVMTNTGVGQRKRSPMKTLLAQPRGKGGTPARRR